MVQRNTREDVPAQPADEDENKRRIQAAKEADLERQTFESQRDPGEPVRLTSEEGTVVTVSGSLVERMKASGYS